jgi:hypothetical protein
MRVSTMLAGYYSSAHSALADPTNGYVSDGDVSVYVKHTPAQVPPVVYYLRDLLSLHLGLSNNKTVLLTVLVPPLGSSFHQVATILGVS